MTTAEQARSVPLAVDLDGTLIHSDLLHEALIRFITQAPLQALSLPKHLLAGRAQFKQQVTRHTPPAPETLPWNHELIAWLTEQKAAGRRIVLCTAADEQGAQRVADYLGIFDEVIASNGVDNLKGADKARRLVSLYGARGFDYVGDTSADLAVWEQARAGIVVSDQDALIKAARKRCRVERVFPPPQRAWFTWLKAVRVHQWAKNVLLFAPLLAAHEFGATAWQHVLLGFVAFCACASAVYLSNDLMDLHSDRLHPRKRDRPFAAGVLPVWQGVAAAAALAAFGLGIAGLVSTGFLALLLLYLTISSSYSAMLKRIPVLDCLVLAGLYTVRVIAGAAAAELPITYWFLAFSSFFFLSLAFIKRYAEIRVKELDGAQTIPGRGYNVQDGPLVLMFGVSAAYAAILLFSVYLHNDGTARLYPRPEFAWAAVFVLLFWLKYAWLKAHRGEMHDDPVLFALRNRVSQLTGACFVALLVIGGLRFPVGASL